MKKIAFSILLMSWVLSVLATESRLAVRVLVPEGDLPAEARTQLEAKLTQMAANYGMVDNGFTDRFYLTANVLTTSKDITPTTPPRVSMKMDVILYFGDVVSGKLYGTYPISVVGVGQNENKACIQAFRQVPVRSKELESFFSVMESEVKDYYIENGNAILRDAELLAKQGSYDEAIASLLSIPDFCGETANAAREAAVKIYQQKIDKEGAALYKRANDLWSVKKDEQTAIEVIDLLSQIDMDSSAAHQGQELVKKMEKYFASRKANEAAKAQQDREFKMKQYEDHLEMQRQQLKDQTSIEKAKIDAMNTAAKKVKRIDIKKVTNIIKGWF